MYIDKRLHKEIEEKFIENISLLGELLKKDKKNIEEIINEDYKYAMMFLYGHLPISDICEDGVYKILLKTVENTFFAKNQTPWGMKIPADIFLAHVLFPRVSNEILEDNRRIFYDLLIDRVKEKSMEEAVIEANYFSFENATYRATDRRTAPPTTLLQSAYGRCGEEAVFTVTALRSISIPARSVYTPIWAHTDNNHAWVEAWIDGEWNYFGACEPEETLNRGWFTSAASRAMLLESRSFFQSENMNSSNEEYTKNGLTYNINLTKNYAKTKPLTVLVVDKNKKPIEGVKVFFNIINHATLVPLSRIITDEKGKVSISLGLGSVTIHLSKDGEYMEYQVNTEETNLVEIEFLPEKFKELTRDFNTKAPVDPGNKVKKLDKEVEESFKANIQNALEIREKKENSFLTPPSALTLNTDIIEEKTLKSILLKAKGNGENIIRFLESNNTKYAEILLKTLNEKDYTDVDEKIISAHLNHALKYKDDFSLEVFSEGILAPRIYFETISDYRDFVDGFFDEKTKSKFRNNPKKIWDYLNENIKYISEKEFLNANSSVITALKTGYASESAKKILFVAIARSIGIPARITVDTVDIEYYDGERFISPIKAEVRDSSLKINFEKGVNWAYGTNWSISRLDGGEFIPLMLRNTQIKDDKLELKSGKYKILTANRLPNGDVYVRQYNIILKSKQSKEVNITLREIEIDSMLNHVEIGDFTVFNNENKEVSVKNTLDSSKNALIWIEQNHEPSQHILNELLFNEKVFKEENINLVFLLRDKKIAENQLINTVIKKLGAKVYFDREFENQESVARRTYVNPEVLPLVILTKGGLNSIFALSGYNVGTANMIQKILGS